MTAAHPHRPDLQSEKTKFLQQGVYGRRSPNTDALAVPLKVPRGFAAQMPTHRQICCRTGTPNRVRNPVSSGIPVCFSTGHPGKSRQESKSRRGCKSLRGSAEACQHEQDKIRQKKGPNLRTSRLAHRFTELRHPRLREGPPLWAGIPSASASSYRGKEGWFFPPCHPFKP